MLDLKGTFSASSYWDGNWKNPKLGSPRGIHNARDTNSKDQWWEVDMPGNDDYLFTAMSIQKRGDG